MHLANSGQERPPLPGTAAKRTLGDSECSSASFLSLRPFEPTSICQPECPRFSSTLVKYGRSFQLGSESSYIESVSSRGASAAPWAMMVSAIQTMEEESLPPLSSARMGLSERRLR